MQQPIKPSAKSILKAQREAKQLKKLERNAKPVRLKSTHSHKMALKNKREAILFNQKNRKTLLFELDSGFHDEAEVESVFNLNKNALNELIYYKNLPKNIAILEMTIRAAKIMTYFLDEFNQQVGDNLRETVRKSELELLDATTLDQSPNQRRSGFFWLDYLIDEMSYWHGAVGRNLIDYIKEYNSAIQFSAYFLAVYQLPEKILIATFAIINGASLRETAKKVEMKENELRIEVLSAAKKLYRIGLTQPQCNGIEPVWDSVIQMRTQQYPYIADFDRFSQMAQIAFRLVDDFNHFFGVDVLNINAFNRRIIEIQKQITMSKWLN